MKKFLFIGCGSIGRRHIENLKSLISCEILAYRVRREDLGEFEKKNNIQTFFDLDEALSQKPDAVFVTNPTSLHLSAARKAAERGCHLFIEKPLSHTLDGVDEFMELCLRQNVMVMLGYKLRFHPSIQFIKKLIDDGSLGEILSAQIHYGGYLPEWHPWEDYRRMYSSRQDLGGGIVLDAIHEIDILYWLLGDVSSVKAIVDKVSDLEIETEDMAEIILRFKSNTIGNIHMNYVQRPEYRSCHLVATEGTVLWDTRQKEVSIYWVKKGKWESYSLEKDFDSNQMFINEVKYFLDCLEGKKKPIHTLQDAKRVLEIALAAKASESI